MAGSRFLGQAVHRATATELELQFTGVYSYRLNRPDFLNNETGEVVELTTPNQVDAHMARPGYEGATYAMYSIPR